MGASVPTRTHEVLAAAAAAAAATAPAPAPPLALQLDAPRPLLSHLLSPHAAAPAPPVPPPAAAALPAEIVSVVRRGIEGQLLLQARIASEPMRQRLADLILRTLLPLGVGMVDAANALIGNAAAFNLARQNACDIVENEQRAEKERSDNIKGRRR